MTLLRDIIEKMRHDGCGGRAGRAELITGIEGVSSRPVRRIVLREGCRSRRPDESQGNRLPACRSWRHQIA
jgi:hypothetical protein